MAKISKISTILVVFLLLIGASLALGESIEFVENKVSIDVLYSNFNDNDQDTITVSGQFTLKNLDTANDAVNLKATFNQLLFGYSANDINISLVPKNGTQVVTFTANVPHKQDSGEKDIGSIIIKNSAEETLDTVILSQNTKPMLELDNLEVEYISEDNNRESDSFNGETEETFQLQENVKPGTEVTLTFDVENLFDNNYDDEGVLEDVTLRIEANDNDLFEDNFEEEYDLGDIDSEDSEELMVSFTVNEDANADDYTFDITLEGDDGKNFNHQVERQLELKVRRQRDDIRISKMEISPSGLSIKDTEFTLDLEVKNYGTRDQRYVSVSVYNSELGINKVINDIELDSFSDDNNYWSQLLEFSLPKNVKQKTYPLEIRAFIDRDELIDIERVNLVISAAVVADDIEDTPLPEEDEEEETTTPPATTPDNNQTAEEEDNGDQITSSPIVSTIEEPYSMEDVLIAVLFVTVGMVIIAIVALFVILIRK